MVNHVEYDPNFRTHKHIDKFAARGMLVDIQRDAAKKETEWEMRRAERREYEKDMPRDNDYFRKMYMDRDEIAEPEITRWVDRVKKPGDAFMKAAASAQRKEKRAIYSSMQRSHEEEKAGTEPSAKYRDRAAERRGDGDNAESFNEFQNKFTSTFSSSADKKQQLIEQSKFLGGDLAHTHLVKGLDYALLQKIRMEQNRKDEDEAAIEEALQEQKAKSDRRLTDKEDLMTIRHPMAKKINHVLFENAPARNIDNFLDGRMAYVFDLDEEYAESDIPTTLLRSKAECPDMSDTLSKTSNDAVIVKLTQILNYIRTGTKKKKTKKLDYDLDQDKAETSAAVKTEKPVDDFKIFSDEDEEMPKSDDDSRRKKKKSSRRRSRSRSRSRDRRDRRDRKRSRSRDRAKRSSKDKKRRRSRTRSRSNSPVESNKPKYFDDIEKDEKIDAPVSLKDITKLAGAYDKKKSTVDRTGKGGVSFGDQVPDSYAECYPSMQYEVSGVTMDSDEEADISKMDVGKSTKGPMTRFDFEDEEKYGDYMAKRETLPKAAFQYGQKNVDRSKLGKKKGNKDNKQKLDQDFQKINNILKKRKTDAASGKEVNRPKY